jgi:CheY-like chemotaxis protein
MAFNYRILWFEDDVEIVEDHRTIFISFLEEYGFDLQIIHRMNSADLDSCIHERYDLILIDLNMSGEHPGDQILNKIRKHNNLTETLLYSNNMNDVTQVIQRHEWVERVSFIASADQFQYKIKQLITLTIKKLQDVNQVRGFVMAETSELDAQMSEIIKVFLTKFKDPEEKALELIDSTISNREDRLNKLLKTQAQDINPFCDNLGVVDRLSAMIRLMKHKDKELEEDIFTANRELLYQYSDEIVEIRNALAHSREFDLDGKKGVISHLNEVHVFFDHESCKKIRKDILKHRHNLEEIYRKVRQLRV